MASPPPKNYVRGTVRLALCSLPLTIAFASIIAGLNEWRTPSNSAVLGARGCLLLAGLVTLLNFHLSFIRPVLHRFRHGSMDSYRFISGLPLIGDVLVIFGCLVSFGNIEAALFGLGSTVFNTGSLLWFMVATWRDIWVAP